MKLKKDKYKEYQDLFQFDHIREFKGERKGYKYGKGPKGLVYYLE